MKLAISTVTKEGSIALSSQGSVYAERNTGIDMITWVPETLNGIIRKSGADGGSIKTVIVSSGPGYFTGTRIGIAFAKGFACGNTVSIEYADSLDIIASIALEKGMDEVRCLLRARKGYYHTALFSKAGRQEENRIVGEDFFHECSDTVLAGEGALYLPPDIIEKNIMAGVLYPDAEFMLKGGLNEK